MRNLSIKKCCLLMSLVLFYPKIVTSKTLDLNYDNISDLALTPRSALQLNACHTKADPMLINVNFEPMFIGSNFTATLIINGDNYTKNYAPFNSLSGMIKTVGVDSDFLIPWMVLVNGMSIGTELYTMQTPDKSVTTYEYSNAFCFKRDYNQAGLGAKDAWPSNDFLPIFAYIQPMIYEGNGTNHRVGGFKSPGDCSHVPETQSDKSANYFWPDYYSPPDYIMNNKEPDFLLKHRFYTKRTAKTIIIPGSSTIQQRPFSPNISDDKHKENNFVYRFPFGKENNKGIRIDNGVFSFKLNNRNISSLILTINNSGLTETWSWSVTKNDKNTLHLTHTQNFGFSALGSDKNDPYFINSFYKDENNLYKGTLVDKTSLTQKYIDYIRDVKPLSLPSNSMGDINLVNTNSLTLNIGQKNSQGGYNSMTFRAYGEPLQFSPLIQNGNEIVSAMQFRNACY
ncbi:MULTISPECIES: hypothetical protein [unclassified Providencia]|uniref:hypothetical protein n=1 Tax=unclassified Providencia TaxID=2633465 RepID=UPI00234B0AB1|nr:MULTISPECIES: hypothetical protein [unclassified Providencia]